MSKYTPEMELATVEKWKRTIKCDNCAEDKKLYGIRSLGQYFICDWCPRINTTWDNVLKQSVEISRVDLKPEIVNALKSWKIYDESTGRIFRYWKRPGKCTRCLTNTKNLSSRHKYYYALESYSTCTTISLPICPICEEYITNLGKNDYDDTFLDLANQYADDPLKLGLDPGVPLVMVESHSMLEAKRRNCKRQPKSKQVELDSEMCSTLEDVDNELYSRLLGSII